MMSSFTEKAVQRGQAVDVKLKPHAFFHAPHVDPSLSERTRKTFYSIQFREGVSANNIPAKKKGFKKVQFNICFSYN